MCIRDRRNSRGCGSFPVCGISVVNQKQQKFRTLQMHEKVAKSKKVPDFARNQELFGGDYWTRTSDLLRVKYSIILSQNIVEGSNRVISRKIETSIEEKSQKLF